MKALILDFDGVISDSVDEVLVVSTRSYRDLLPDARLPDLDDPRFRRNFRELMPLGNRAEDYGTALAALEKGVSLADQAAYDRFRAAQDPAWLECYHRRFYEVRESLATTEPDRWHSLMKPYPGLLELLRRRANEQRYAIATSKDRPSVLTSLHAYDVADLFPAELVLDKETAKSKEIHLRRLGALLDLPLPELTFVDDKVNHLDTVGPLGVRCALAAWGYNGKREHDLARDRGYLVCTLEDVEEQLFDRR